MDFFKVYEAHGKRIIDIEIPWLVYERKPSEVNKFYRCAMRMMPDEVNLKINTRSNATELEETNGNGSV